MERNPDRLAVLSLSSDAWSAKAMGVLMARTQTTSTCSRCALVLCFTGVSVFTSNDESTTEYRAKFDEYSPLQGPRF
jgi:hypothetical protein